MGKIYVEGVDSQSGYFNYKNEVFFLLKKNIYFFLERKVNNVYWGASIYHSFSTMHPGIGWHMSPRGGMISNREVHIKWATLESDEGRVGSHSALDWLMRKEPS